MRKILVGLLLGFFALSAESATLVSSNPADWVILDAFFTSGGGLGDGNDIIIDTDVVASVGFSYGMGSIQITSTGSLTVPGDFTVGKSGSTLTIDDGGELTVSGLFNSNVNTTIDGTVTAGTGSFLGAVYTIGVNGSLTFSGDFTAGDSGNLAASYIEIADGGQLIVGGHMSNDLTTKNYGYIETGSARWYSVDATFENHSTGVIRSLGLLQFEVDLASSGDIYAGTLTIKDGDLVQTAGVIETTGDLKIDDSGSGGFYISDNVITHVGGDLVLQGWLTVADINGSIYVANEVLFTNTLGYPGNATNQIFSSANSGRICIAPSTGTVNPSTNTLGGSTIYTDPRGTANNNSGLIISTAPAPDITGVISTCVGTSLPYQIPITANTVVWSVTGGLMTPGAQDELIMVDWNTVGTGEVIVTETMPDGCDFITVPFEVEIANLPTVTNPSFDVCGGTNYDLTQHDAVVGGGDPVAWFTDAGATISAVSPIANLAGTYYARIGTGSCTAISTVTFNIVANPDLTLTINGADICSNITTAAIVIENSENNIDYTLRTLAGVDVLGPLSGDGNNLTFNVTGIAGATTYQVWSSGGVGCEGYMNTDPAVQILPDPQDVAVSDATICPGADATITIPATENGATYSLLTLADAPVGPVAITGAGAAGSFTAFASTAQTYKVNATLNGCSADLTDQPSVSLHALPTAVLSGDANLCPGGTTDLTVALTGAGPWTIDYTLGGAAQPQENATTPAHTISGVGGGIYVLTAVSDNNCPGTSFTGSATVNDNSGPSSSISGTASVCDAGTTNVTITLSGTAPFNFIYTDGATPTSVNAHAANTLVFPATAGTYTVTSITDANCPGTPDASSAIVTQYTTPTISVSNPANPVCNQGGGTYLTTVNLASLVTGDAGAWADDDNYLGGGLAAAIGNTNLDFDGVIIPPASYDFTYTSTTAVAPCVNVTGTATVTVEDCSCLSVTTANPPAICAAVGNSVNMNAASIKITSEPGTWTLTGLPGGLITPPVLTGASLDVAPASAGTYTLTWTIDPARQAVMDASCPISSTVDFVINAIPTAMITGSTSYCEGDNATLTGTGGTGYVWSYPATSTQAASLTTVASIANVATTDAGTYSLTVTDVNSCTSLPVTEAITVDVKPVVNSILSAGLLCEGESITIAASVSPATGITYAWLTPAGNQTTDQLLINSADPIANSGDYTLTITNVAACVSDPLIERITINATPTVNLGVDLDYCPGKGLAAVVEQASLQGSYVWMLDGAQESTQSSYYEFSAAGYVVATVIDLNGCTGIGDMTINQKCPPEMFPPNSFIPRGVSLDREFTIALSSNASASDFDYYLIKIFDRWGEQVFESSSIDNHWDGMYRNKIVPAGAYLYVIEYAYSSNGDQTVEELKGKLTLVR